MSLGGIAMFSLNQHHISARCACRKQRRGRLLCGLIGLLLLTLAPQFTQAQQFTNRARFGIPFEFDPAELTRLGAVEIRLYLSTDNGENWRQAQTVAPDAGRFQFEAPADGRYVFAVRTVDNRGRLHPTRELSPELQVVVDQSTPQITLTLVSTRAGEVTALWQAQDANLDVESLDLQYSVNGRDWNDVAGVDAAVGQIRFGNELTGTVTVRMTAADRAGNPQVVTRELNLDEDYPPSDDDGDSSGPNFERPVAILPGTQSEQSASLGNPIIRPGSLRGPATPTLTSSIVTDEGERHETEEPAALTRRVNALTFRIGYEVAEIGPSGVGEVEFFITEDAGANWFHYGTDDDGASPFEVTVPSDGEYGFSMRVKSGIGLSNPPPQPGESPDSYIIVDRAAPTVSLLPLIQGAGDQQNEVIIEWQVQDALLADRPISLFYSTNREMGDWEPITGWMSNSGRYQWAVSPQFRKSVYIRLDARDAAGNVVSVVSENPVVLDRSRPQARITDVETIQP